MAKKIGRWGIARKFFVGDPSKGVPKLGSVTASAFKEGQEVVFADDPSGKLAANLNKTVSNKVNNSLQLPAQPPATEKLVAIGANGEQKLVDPPSGGSLYLHQVEFADPSQMANAYLHIISSDNTPYTADTIINAFSNGRYVLGYADIGGVTPAVMSKNNNNTSMYVRYSAGSPQSRTFAFTTLSSDEVFAL